MSKTNDWLPNSNVGIPAMANGWIVVCTVRLLDRNIPAQALAKLTTLKETAAATLVAAMFFLGKLVKGTSFVVIPDMALV